jgi:hypothetical protein
VRKDTLSEKAARPDPDKAKDRLQHCFMIARNPEAKVLECSPFIEEEIAGFELLSCASRSFQRTDESEFRKSEGRYS